MVCTFLAILELIRLKQIRAAQEPGDFTDIVILKTEDEEAPPPMDEMTSAELFAREGGS
jgi:chromatin segregation and condensation protein Rec8/ScpA/Scc1 (kleisin family)